MDYNYKKISVACKSNAVYIFRNVDSKKEIGCFDQYL